MFFVFIYKKNESIFELNKNIQKDFLQLKTNQTSTFILNASSKITLSRLDVWLEEFFEIFLIFKRQLLPHFKYRIK